MAGPQNNIPLRAKGYLLSGIGLITTLNLMRTLTLTPTLTLTHTVSIQTGFKEPWHYEQLLSLLCCCLILTVRDVT